MQLVRLTSKLKPITLAAGLFSAVTTFAYSDVDNFSSILSIPTNNKTSQYIKLIDNNEGITFQRKLKFESHLNEWKNKTLFLSSPKSIIEDEDFQSIIAMGHSAVPFILEQIENNPSTLVWALNLIYNQKVTNNPNATISDACKLWVKMLKN